MTKQTKIIIGVVAISVVLIFSTLFFILPRGSDLTVEAPAPPREVKNLLLPPPIPSVIAVQADLPIQDVKILAESALKDYLNKPIQRKDGAIESFIKLNPGNLTMTSIADGTVSVSIPLQFNGWAEVSKKILGTAIRKRQDVEGSATASLTLTPTLNPDWRITAKTTADIFIQKAEFEILGITISIRRILTKLVKDIVLPKLEDSHRQIYRQHRHQNPRCWVMDKTSRTDSPQPRSTHRTCCRTFGNLCPKAVQRQENIFTQFWH